jgi:predicted amidohydrolase YtcJ
LTDAAVFVGGRILTGTGYAEALLVEDGRVLAVGAEASVRPAVPTGAERVELEGRLVVPGLADAHLHLGELARGRRAFDASSPRSIAALTGELAGWASSHPDGPLVGRGLQPERLAERRSPTLDELDTVVGDRPVVLFHASGHAAALNTAAFDVAYGARVRPAGMTPPSSVVVEEALEPLRPLVAAALPLVTGDLEAVGRELLSFGLTTVGTMNTSAEELSALADLATSRRLPLRVRSYPPLASVGQLLPRRSWGEEGELAVVGVKGFLDGAFGPRTAALAEPYADAPDGRGVDRGTDEEVASALEEARRRGLQPALHAIGDRAVARAARLLGALPAADLPPRIEHASLTPPGLLARLARLRAQLVVQPGFVVSDTWLGDRLGPERARFAYLFRAFRDLGLSVAGSSDAPFDPPDPWQGIRAAVRRRDGLGRSANPRHDQALTVEAAVGLYTGAAHRAVGAPGGRLEPGAPADLAVLGVRRLEETVSAGAAVVRETWLRGRRAFPRGGGAGTADMAPSS